MPKLTSRSDFSRIALLDFHRYLSFFLEIFKPFPNRQKPKKNFKVSEAILGNFFQVQKNWAKFVKSSLIFLSFYVFFFKWKGALFEANTVSKFWSICVLCLFHYDPNSEKSKSLNVTKITHKNDSWKRTNYEGRRKNVIDFQENIFFIWGSLSIFASAS